MSLQELFTGLALMLMHVPAHDHSSNDHTSYHAAPYRTSDRYVPGNLLAGVMALRIQDDEILGVEAYAAELELLINGANQVPCSPTLQSSEMSSHDIVLRQGLPGASVLICVVRECLHLEPAAGWHPAGPARSAGPAEAAAVDRPVGGAAGEAAPAPRGGLPRQPAHCRRAAPGAPLRAVYTLRNCQRIMSVHRHQHDGVLASPAGVSASRLCRTVTC